MKICHLIVALSVAGSATSITSLSFAQNAAGSAQGQVTLGNGSPAQALPPSRWRPPLGGGSIAIGPIGTALVASPAGRGLLAQIPGRPG